MNKIYILTTVFIIMFFIFSCKNVNILNPNENDVEVFYVDSFYIDSSYYYDDRYHNIVEYRIKTNKSSGNIEMIPDMQFKIKDYQNDFRNISVFRAIHSNFFTYEATLRNSKTSFSMEFFCPFGDSVHPFHICYIRVGGGGQIGQVWDTTNRFFAIAAIETNGKLNFEWNYYITNGVEITNTKVSTPFEFNDDEFKTYNYLTDEENFILNLITYTVKAYKSLCTNGFLKNYLR